MMRHRIRWLGRRKASRIKSPRATTMGGGVQRVGITIHTEGVERSCPGRGHDFGWLAHFVIGKGVEYHALHCLRCNKIIQMLPFDSPARSLKGGGIVPNGASANRAGQANIQVCFVGVGPNHRYTQREYKNMRIWGKVADSWGIPHRVRKTWGGQAKRGRKSWLRSGIHGHCHSPAPYENHTDPNKIDARKLRRALWAD